MIKIEFLFPEIANLFGDPFNIKYLKNSLKDVQIIETSLTDTPKFLNGDIDMIYLGSMSEKSQELVINKLKNYKKELQNFINTDKVALFTGNAFEILGKYIEDENNKKIEGLGLIETYAKRDLKHRYNTLFLGEFETNDKIKIMGFKSTFSFSYSTNNEQCYLFKAIRGCGLNKESNLEGFRIKNCFCTYLIGPLLILNPIFTKYIMKLLGEKEPKLQYEEESMECYYKRLKEFERKETDYLQ